MRKIGLARELDHGIGSIAFAARDAAFVESGPFLPSDAP
jgi:hypothetical protein